MLARLTFIALALFWLVMNALLWRAEYGIQKHLGSPVALELVWQKILTAPDTSSLEISHKGKKIGICRWSATVAEEGATGKAAKADRPEGRVLKLSGYSIDLEGNLQLTRELDRFRFHFNLQFGTNHQWREFTLRAGQRPQFWELHSSAAQETLYFRLENEQGKWERTFQFAEFQNPQKLMQEVGMPFLPALLAPALGKTTHGLPRLGLRWEARHDWLEVGHANSRVYRLQARLFDRYQVVVFVSRVGEILQAELPDNIILVNEALTHL